jgi:hypothetical protein
MLVALFYVVAMRVGAYAQVSVVETIERRVTSGSDDAEEEAVSGNMYLTSSDLEMTYDYATQTVGMRFNWINIPQGANIINAYIQFQADNPMSVPTSLIIEGEAVDNALTFANGDWNISSRARTTAAVGWTPVPWPSRGAMGVAQRTSDISSVIEEIVNQGGWSSGNSLVIIVTGTGERVAESYEGYPARAPLLHVEYSMGPPSNQAPEVEAGSNQVIMLPTDSVLLDGTVMDDGLPEGSSVSVTWSHVGGTGTGDVSFGDETAIDTTASISPAYAGTYVLRLEASDTEETAFDELTITVTIEEIIIDNGDTGALSTGSWYVSGGPNPYGSNSLYANAAGATYTFEYPFLGTVMALDVYQWWTYYSNRCIDTKIEISDSIGLLDTLYINQRENISQWYYYDRYLFESFARVRIISEGGCTVNADAVSFVTAPLSDINCNGIDDDSDGIVDDDYVPNDTCGEGVCRTNNIPSSCVSGVETTCQPGIPTEATEVSCGDGLDNDCDGAIDALDTDCQECSPTDTQSCTTGLAGVCEPGTCSR